MTITRAIVTAALLTIGVAGCRRTEPAPAPDATTPAVQETSATPDPSTSHIYLCPMDKDIRSYGPGKCPRCGMTLVTDIPEPAEYHLDLSVDPPPLPNQKTRLTFAVSDPWKGNPVTKFGLVHEKLFHAFIVSRDLEFFVHDHPVWNGSVFQYDVVLPKPGMYRVLGDFYPEAATPQLLTQTVFVAGNEPPPARLSRDYSGKQASNLRVEMTTNPPNPIAGEPTQLRFSLSPGTGIERLLGAWAHMLAASDDLIDMMHEHPSLADGSPEMQFSLTFPRSRMYRVWVQFQRDGVVNTAHFDVPVAVEHPHPGVS
jgi:heavy metal-binding protein